jgi:hypothetical protein
MSSSIRFQRSSPRNKLRLITATIIGALAVGAGSVRAGDAPAPIDANGMAIGELAAKDIATSDSAASPAPSPNYSGDFLTRSTLTGDWGGLRNDLAKMGITFDVSLTQTYPLISRLRRVVTTVRRLFAIARRRISVCSCACGWRVPCTGRTIITLIFAGSY